MILRPYQARVVKDAVAALKKHKNTMVIGSTGAGKTIMLAALAGEIGGKTLIMQHRQELIDQNRKKFLLVNPDQTTSLFTAETKSFAGDAVFSMQQTLCRNLSVIPKFDHLIVDETHHLAARTYQDIFKAVKQRNPDCLLTGFTATPERGDRKSLGEFFNNVSAKIGVRELVQKGFLVEPRAMVVDVGVNPELARINTTSNFGDQAEVAQLLDTEVINEEVIRHWRQHASDRKTIVFCSTVQHAIDVAKSFSDSGINSDVVTGDMPTTARQETLRRFDKGATQVLVNVAVLTEGFDSQPVSCVILLRKCSDKSTMIQMAGRGLRIVDPELYPGVVKRDCIIMDFGLSIATHGNLDVGEGLIDEGQLVKGEPIFKKCPEVYKTSLKYRFPDRNGNNGCGCEVPAQCKTCPMCGFVFDRLDMDEQQTVDSVVLTEIDILNASPFRWYPLFESENIKMACGFEAWAGIFSKDGDTYYAIGKLKSEKYKVHKLAISSKLLATCAADDFLRANECNESSKKSRRWMTDEATEKQLSMLGGFGYQNQTLSKYGAMCHAEFRFNQRLIENALGVI